MKLSDHKCAKNVMDVQVGRRRRITKLMLNERLRKLELCRGVRYEKVCKWNAGLGGTKQGMVTFD